MNAPHVLVLEDEPLILTAIEAALMDAGYDVIACSSAEEAADQLQRCPEPIGGLITDIRLAGSEMSGWDVARRARALFPRIGVLYISGDSGGDWGAQGVPDSLFIQKPFSDARAVAAMSTILDPSSGGPVDGATG